MSTKKSKAADTRDSIIADLQAKLASVINNNNTDLRRERDEMSKDFTECCESVENENALIGAYIAQRIENGSNGFDAAHLVAVRIGIRLALG